jgi:universal stress protein E
VWLVGRQRVAQPPYILAAVDTDASGRGAEELNREIMEVALTLAKAGDARMTVLHAWSLFGEELLRGHMPDRERREVVRAAEREALEGLEGFVTEFGSRADGVHLECIKGEPQRVIPRFVADHSVDAVVMGTVARKGIAGFVIGNTAETILRELGGSVVAVKPPRFVTPVATQDRAGHAGRV